MAEVTESGWHREQIGPWHYVVRPKRNGGPGTFIGFAKQSPFVTQFCGMDEPGPIWFQFGATVDDVMAALKAETVWA